MKFLGVLVMEIYFLKVISCATVIAYLCSCFQETQKTPSRVQLHLRMDSVSSRTIEFAVGSARNMYNCCTEAVALGYINRAFVEEEF